MLLYQPTASEIASALARAAANYPHIAGDGRLNRAATLLASVHTWSVFTDQATVWRIPSCSDPTASWHLEGYGCDCPDHAAAALLVDGRPLCKHSLALRAYRHILLTRLTAQIAEEGIRLLYMGYGHWYAYRDGTEFRVWREFDPVTGQARGPYRFRTDDDLCCYAEQLHAEAQPDYTPPAYAFHRGIPISVPPRPQKPTEHSTE